MEIKINNFATKMVKILKLKNPIEPKKNNNKENGSRSQEKKKTYLRTMAAGATQSLREKKKTLTSHLCLALYTHLVIGEFRVKIFNIISLLFINFSETPHNIYTQKIGHE